MDLRPYLASNPILLKKGTALIQQKMLNYQPYIFANDIEVGEGQNLVNQLTHDYYSVAESVFDYNTYTPNLGFQIGKQPELSFFRRCNEEYRSLYTQITDHICKHFNNDISKMSFAEIGCNTGINLYNLAVRGAGQCFGYDWNSFDPVFAWFNKVLGVNVRFRQGVYNNLLHRLDGGVDVPEVDVMLNTVFINHQCDPIQFLCYICDRARKGVFLWVDTVKDDACAIYYPFTADMLLGGERPFPLFFNNGVRLSENLLLVTLKQLGFKKVDMIEPSAPSPAWKKFTDHFKMYYAERTSETRSAYWGIKT